MNSVIWPKEKDRVFKHECVLFSKNKDKNDYIEIQTESYEISKTNKSEEISK